MSTFILLLHQSPMRFADLSPEEIQKIVSQYIAWREDLVQRGQLRGGEKLTADGGRQVRLQNGQVSVTDGPFTETTEVLGGYFLIEADNYAAATAIAETCPHLNSVQWVEVRQLEPVH
jgi:hypothetical protein